MTATSPAVFGNIKLTRHGEASAIVSVEGNLVHVSWDTSDSLRCFFPAEAREHATAILAAADFLDPQSAAKVPNWANIDLDELKKNMETISRYMLGPVVDAGIPNPTRAWENGIEARLDTLSVLVDVHEQRDVDIMERLAKVEQWQASSEAADEVLSNAADWEPSRMDLLKRIEAVEQWREECRQTIEDVIELAGLPVTEPEARVQPFHVYKTKHACELLYTLIGEQWFITDERRIWRELESDKPGFTLDIAAGNADPWHVSPLTRAGDRVIGKDETLPNGWIIHESRHGHGMWTQFVGPHHIPSNADHARACLAIEHATSLDHARLLLIHHLSKGEAK